MPLLDPSRRRMLVMPLVILAVGCGIALWSSTKREQQRREVVVAITQLVQDVCSGSQANLPLDPAAESLASQMLIEIRKTCTAGAALNVQSATGDVEHAGSAGGAATHHAMIRKGDEVLLVLRVHFDDNGILRILGFVAPPGP